MARKIKVYVISIAAALVVGGLSAVLTMGGMDFYQEIVTPPLAPPGIVFPIVWTVLYILMGIGSARVYLAREKDISASNRALVVYGINLFVNFFWSILFFNLQAFLIAFLWLLLLWAIILFMIIKFQKIDPAAAYLQIPYLLWVTFAGYLNLAIYILNR